MRLCTLLALAAFLSPLFVPLALADHPLTCSRPLDGGNEGTVIVEPTAGFVSGNFVVPCLRIDSGGGVTFVVTGVGEHDIRTRDCFRARDDLGRMMQAGDVWRVEMHYPTVGQLYRAVGDEQRDCSRAIDWSHSNRDHAYILYECDRHRSFRGAIIVDVA